MTKTFNAMLLFLSGGCLALILIMAVPVLGSKVASFLERSVLEDFTATEWKFDQQTRFWSARIYGRKVDSGCKYVKGQELIALAKPTPSTPPFEIPFGYLEDSTPDSNRPAGFQDFGRWEFQEANLFKGFIISPRLKHYCAYRGDTEAERNFTSTIGPFVIGK